MAYRYTPFGGPDGHSSTAEVHRREGHGRRGQGRTASSRRRGRRLRDAHVDRPAADARRTHRRGPGRRQPHRHRRRHRRLGAGSGRADPDDVAAAEEREAALEAQTTGTYDPVSGQYVTDEDDDSKSKTTTSRSADSKTRRRPTADGRQEAAGGDRRKSSNRPRPGYPVRARLGCSLSPRSCWAKSRPTTRPASQPRKAPRKPDALNHKLGPTSRAHEVGPFVVSEEQDPIHHPCRGVRDVIAVRDWIHGSRAQLAPARERRAEGVAPSTWPDARLDAHLEWEIGTEAVYVVDDPGPEDLVETFRLKDWQAIYRDDKTMAEPEQRYLAVQPSTYKVITNSRVRRGDRPGLRHHRRRRPGHLRGPDEPLRRPPDRRPDLLRRAAEAASRTRTTHTYRFVVLCSRHDGNGGLRGLATNVRVVCSNTMALAEAIDGRKTGFTIRHTSNWRERLDEVRRRHGAGPRRDPRVGEVRRGAGQVQGRPPSARDLPQAVPADRRRHEPAGGAATPRSPARTCAGFCSPRPASASTRRATVF